MIEFEKTTIVFKDYDGNKHKFDIPPYLDLKQAQKELMDNVGAADEVIIKSLVRWGVSKDVVESLELGHIKKLWDSVLSSKKD